MTESDLQYFIASPFFAGIGQEAPTSRDAFLSRFDALSTVQKDIITSTDTAYRIADIGKGAGLDEEQTEFLAIVVREVMTGLASPADVGPLLMSHLEIDAGLANGIAGRVWSEVLNNVSVQNQPNPLPVSTPTESPAPRQLNQSTPGQQGEGDHIINLREDQ